jgi:transcriptional regulator with XRE-family HTH domain
MGQAPRSLEASASARHYFGAELRRLRNLKQLSQDQLGKRVCFSGDTIRRVETADRFPRRELAEACDRELDTGGTLGRLWRLLERERPDQVRDTGMNGRSRPGGNDEGTERHPRPPEQAFHTHRSRVPFLPTALDRVALDWLLNVPGPVIRAEGRRGSDRRVEDGDVDEAVTAMSVFRELDHAHGAGRLYAEVEDYLTNQLGPMLAGTPVSNDVGTRLHTLAAGFFELCGYQAVDVGADGVAQQHYVRALQLSQMAGDCCYGSYLLGVNIGHLALHCNHPEPALRMALAALSGVRDAASPAVRAALHSVVARAHARLGHGPQCIDEILVAESQLQRSKPDSEPAWIGYFTPAYLADEMAHCFYDLGDHPLAQQHVGEALDGLEPWHVRRLAIDTALLASSLASQGQIDRACVIGRKAVDHAARTASHRCTQRIVSMRVRLEPYQAEPTVGELIDYIHDRLPAAA